MDAVAIDVAESHPVPQKPCLTCSPNLTSLPNATVGNCCHPTSFKLSSLPKQYAISMARHPRLHFAVAIFLTLTFSTIGMTCGGFTLRMNAMDWWSQGTVIAKRSAQERILLLSTTQEEEEEKDSEEDNDEEEDFVQQQLMPTTQEEEETEEEEEEEEDNDEEEDFDGRRDSICSNTWYGSEYMTGIDEMNLISIWKVKESDDTTTSSTKQYPPNLSVLNAETIYELCLAEETTLQLLEQHDLCYECPSSSTNGITNDSDSDHATDSKKCIQPLSLVTIAHMFVSSLKEGRGFNFGHSHIDCHTLREQWSDTVQHSFSLALKECVNDYNIPRTEVCNIVQFIVDDEFRYTSAIYGAKNDDASIQKMFQLSQSNQFPSSNKHNTLEGVYDVGLSSIYSTNRKGFYYIYLEYAIYIDLALAVGSAVATFLCILIHTKSVLLTIVAIMQIMLAFPMAYFFYRFVLGLTIFPFINLGAIFVVFALGCDDVFVIVDKWKNARIALPHQSTTQEVAALVLPNGALATGITSVTTAGAFFGGAVSPVPAIQCFSIFCGLLVAFDYVLSILLVFPALIVYDELISNSYGEEGAVPSKFVTFGRPCKIVDPCVWPQKIASSSSNSDGTDGFNESDEEAEFAISKDADTAHVCSKRDIIENEDKEANLTISEDTDRAQGRSTRDITENEGSASKKSHNETKKEGGTLIHRSLASYYNLLHKVRWILLPLSAAAIIAFGFVALQLKTPDSVEIPFLPSSNPYEKHRIWSKHLISDSVHVNYLSVIWGLDPADTGSYLGRSLNPDGSIEPTIDDKFNPRSEAAQIYLFSICERLFADGFMKRFRDGYRCPLNRFDDWLKDQAESGNKTVEYVQNCNGATSVPVSSDVFDSCIISWSILKNERSIFYENGEVIFYLIRGISNTTFESELSEQDAEWHNLEDWSNNERSMAPDGVQNFFISSFDFLWYDTIRSIMASTYKSVGIALACASVAVIFTSRSLKITLFSAVSILYVILGATASVVGFGWTLGLFESILFSVLIGIGCDYVLHFGSAYIMYQGNVSRHERTRFAILHMGPSILASGASTLITAIIMLFTETQIFHKFGVMLAMTTVHSMIGSFVIFLGLCDSMGPSNPKSRHNK